MSCARSFWPEPSSTTRSTSGPTAPSPSASGAESASSVVPSPADSTPVVEQTSDAGDMNETCDLCGMAQVTWRKCKLVCHNCGTILKSCADL